MNVVRYVITFVTTFERDEHLKRTFVMFITTLYVILLVLCNTELKLYIPR
jgi:hypothetical protein